MPEDSNPRPPDDTSLIQGRNWLTMKLVIFICDITPKCPEVIRMISQGMDRPLPLMTRLKLRIHYLMCCYCERYAKQLHYIRAIAGDCAVHAELASQQALPPEVKVRFKRALREQVS